MSHSISLRRLAVATVLGVSLAACSQNDGGKTDGTAAPAAKPEAAAPVEMAQALDKSQVGATYAVDAAGARLRDGTVIRIPVSITNNGKVALVSKGAYPVRLGAQLVGPDGKVIRRDFVRVSLSPLVPGETAQTVVEVPAKEVVGNSVRFDLVQEKVNWFSSFDVPTQDYGPVTECAGAAGQYCGPDGNPIQAAQ